jgi:hypothetical protein
MEWQILRKITNFNILMRIFYGDIIFVIPLFLVLKQKFSSLLKCKGQEKLRVTERLESLQEGYRLWQPFSGNVCGMKDVWKL